MVERTEYTGLSKVSPNYVIGIHGWIFIFNWLDNTWWNDVLLCQWIIHSDIIGRFCTSTNTITNSSIHFQIIKWYSICKWKMPTYRSKSTKSCSFGTSWTCLNEMVRDDSHYLDSRTHKGMTCSLSFSYWCETSNICHFTRYCLLYSVISISQYFRFTGMSATMVSFSHKYHNCFFVLIFTPFFRHLNSSATVLQRRWRGYLGRKYFRILLKVRLTSSNGYFVTPSNYIFLPQADLATIHVHWVSQSPSCKLPMKMLLSHHFSQIRNMLWTSFVG
jgi:hypothetical protein